MCSIETSTIKTEYWAKWPSNEKTCTDTTTRITGSHCDLSTPTPKFKARRILNYPWKTRESDYGWSRSHRILIRLRTAAHRKRTKEKISAGYLNTVKKIWGSDHVRVPLVKSYLAQSLQSRPCRCRGRRVWRTGRSGQCAPSRPCTLCASRSRRPRPPPLTTGQTPSDTAPLAPAPTPFASECSNAPNSPRKTASAIPSLSSPFCTRTDEESKDVPNLRRKLWIPNSMKYFVSISSWKQIRKTKMVLNRCVNFHLVFHLLLYLKYIFDFVSI